MRSASAMVLTPYRCTAATERMQATRRSMRPHSDRRLSARTPAGDSDPRRPVVPGEAAVMLHQATARNLRQPLILGAPLAQPELSTSHGERFVGRIERW